MLELQNVSKSYGGKKALQNINLQIPQGEIIGLFGENSAYNNWSFCWKLCTTK